MSADLWVPVERVPAEILFEDGSTHSATVFNAPGAPVEELLASESRFFPAQTDAGVLLCARTAVACISVLNRARPGTPDAHARAGDTAGDELPTRQLPVRVRLRGGASFTGELRFVPSTRLVRTADVLNEPTPTFALYDSSWIRHIAKAHVTLVEER